MASRSQYGRENNVMVNTLKNLDRIRTNTVEKVFRAVDRGDYVTPDDRYLAYMQQPWRSGHLHLSAPCIYGEVVEALNLRPGQSFLNIGSGTGYLNTLVGLIIGCSGINHGVEVQADVVEYANKRLEEFIKSSPALDEFDFCAPKFYCGNGLCLSSVQNPYDRVYCGADCPGELLSSLRQLIKIGGVLVVPSGNKLLQIERKTVATWITTTSMNVSFTPLKLPTAIEIFNSFTIEWTSPQRLQILSYAVVRKCMRAAQLSRSPRVSEPLLRNPGLTDFDVNELLRLILSMDENRDYAIPLSRFSYEKLENDVKEDNTVESKLTLKNDVDASTNKAKPTNTTQTDDVLDKSDSAQVNKLACSPLFANLVDETKKSVATTLDTNKELDQLNTALSNTTLAAPEQPKLTPHTSTKPNKYDSIFKDNVNTSGGKSVKVEETLKKIENGVQGNDKSIFEGLQRPLSEILKEIKNQNLALSNDSAASGDKEKPVNITDNKKDLKKKYDDQPNSSKPISFVEEIKKIENKHIKAFNFTPPTQNSSEPSIKFNLSGITTDKTPKSNEKSNLNLSTTNASDGKENFSTCTIDKWLANVDTSKVFVFSDGKKDPSSSSPSPLKTKENKSPKKNIVGVEKSSSALPNPVAEPAPDVELNPTNEDLKDSGLSIVVRKGVVEVQLPYEQKESANITVTKMNYKNKATNTIDDESSSQPNTSKSSEAQLTRSLDIYNSDIFHRLKAALSPMPLTKVLPPVVVRISLKTLNYYSAWIWDSMMMTYDQLDQEINRAIFQKGALLLAEAKVAYAQRTFPQTPKEALRCRNTFTDEELLNFKEMASRLPLPLAAYLECIGNTNSGDQLITPVIVEHPQNVMLSAAPTHMLSLFKQLRFGVPLNGPLYRRARELGLPMLHWEDVPNTTVGAEQGSSRMRITSESYNFWVTTRNGSSVIKWDADDSRIFKTIVLSLNEKKGHNVDFDLSHGFGSQAQLVQTIDYKVDAPTKWLISVPVDDYSIKLGAAFAFHCPIDEQGATIPPQTYMSGQITPRRVMFAILCSIYHS